MREEIEARISAICIAGLILGLIAILHPLAFLVLLAAAIWLRPIRAKSLVCITFVVGLALSPVPPKPLTEGTPMDGVGTVVSVPLLHPDSQVCDFELRGHMLSLELPRSPGVMLGDRVRVAGIAKPPQSSAVQRRFETIVGRLRVDQFKLVEEGSWVAHLADEWRRSFMTFLGGNLSSRDAELVDALCFNARTMLEPQTREQFAKSGAVHIVSASGLQVFIFGALLTLALRFFPVPRWAQIGLLAALLAVYAIAAGLQPQIVRAALMALLGLSAYLVKRDPDALSALCLSAGAYLLWRPQAIFEMAFQLSFITVACIILFFHRTPKAKSSTWKTEVIRRANDFLKVSAILTLATLPLVAYYLGVVSTVSVFANLMVWWCLPLVVGIAFCAHGVWFLLPSVGNAIASEFLTPLCHWIYRTLDAFGEGSWTIQAPSFSVYWLFAFYGAWLMTYRRQVVQP